MKNPIGLTIYEKNGYEDRAHYLRNLAADHGVPLSVVMEFADNLGEMEDFDSLVTEIEDYAEEMEGE